MSAIGGKADIIQGKADIKKCPLMTQSGHQRQLAIHFVPEMNLKSTTAPAVSSAARQSRASPVGQAP